MLKKEIDWIQPPTERGVASNQMPDIPYERLLEASQSVPEVGISQWSDIDKIDMRPSKGIAKVVSKTGWEVQVDTSNGNVLSANYRRSDLIESIHDGSYFAGWTKVDKLVRPLTIKYKNPGACHANFFLNVVDFTRIALRSFRPNS